MVLPSSSHVKALAGIGLLVLSGKTDSSGESLPLQGLSGKSLGDICYIVGALGTQA